MALQIYPCKLTLLLLPWWQLAELSWAAGASETLAAAYRAPVVVHFNAQMAVLCALGVRTLGATGMALYAWTWIRSSGLWTLVLPHGQDVMNIPFGVLALAGGWLAARLPLRALLRLVESPGWQGSRWRCGAAERGASLLSPHTCTRRQHDPGTGVLPVVCGGDGASQQAACGGRGQAGEGQGGRSAERGRRQGGCRRQGLGQGQRFSQKEMRAGTLLRELECSITLGAVSPWVILGWHFF